MCYNQYIPSERRGKVQNRERTLRGMTEREYIEKQANALGVTIVGKLRRSAEHETAEVEKCFEDEGGNLYMLRHGILTIRGADGRVY